jgi:hypothetical protein
MDKNYIANNVLQAPGLAITGASGTVAKTSNTFSVKVNGLISAPKTTADLPSFATSLGPKGVASTNLADDLCRIYTVLASVAVATGAVTLVLRHGPDFTKSAPSHTSEAYKNAGNAGDEDKALVGYIYVKNETGSDWVPGTTALDLTGVTARYSDAFGYVGM